MIDDKGAENASAELKEQARRAYVAPTVRDFFQPVVVLGTTGATEVGTCATPRRPKR
jgi:hypothetical protein